MIAALGTLPFLATLWLLVVVGATTLEESGAKIAAALRAQSQAQPSGLVSCSRIRSRMRTRQPMRARPRLLVAA